MMDVVLDVQKALVDRPHTSTTTAEPERITQQESKPDQPKLCTNERGHTGERWGAEVTRAQNAGLNRFWGCGGLQG